MGLPKTVGFQVLLVGHPARPAKLCGGLHLCRRTALQIRAFSTASDQARLWAVIRTVRRTRASAMSAVCVGITSAFLYREGRGRPRVNASTEGHQTAGSLRFGFLLTDSRLRIGFADGGKAGIDGHCREAFGKSCAVPGKEKNIRVGRFQTRQNFRVSLKTFFPPQTFSASQQKKKNMRFLVPEAF